MTWAWLFPVAYLLHIAEEYWGGIGYTEHLSQTKGIQLTSLRFFLMTGFGLILLAAGIVLAQAFRFPQLLLVIYGAVFLSNGLSHAASSLSTRTYNPGLISGVAVWIPLGLFSLLGLWGNMHTSRYILALSIGVAIQVVVSLLALSGGNISRV